MSSDFAWLPVGTCQMILEEFEKLEKKTEEQEERIAIMTEGKEGNGNEQGAAERDAGTV